MTFSDRTPAAPKAAPAKTNSGGCGCLVLIIVAIAGVVWFLNLDHGSSVASQWSLDGAKSAMSGAGFSDGSSSPLADGTPRWLIRGPESASFEAIGDPAAITQVSLTLGVTDTNTNSSTALNTFLGTWAPDASSFMKESLIEALLTDVDERKGYAGYLVHVQTIAATDGTILVVTVLRT